MTQKSCCLFVMPRKSTAWQGAEAIWITVGGLAMAAERRFGNAWIITLDEIVRPAEIFGFPRAGFAKKKSGPHQYFKRFVPTLFSTFLKDILLWRTKSRYVAPENVPWQGYDVQFVWQQHDFFDGPGRMLADSLKVPLITKVDAPLVWEAKRWGVQRPLWGKLIEKYAELNAFNKSDYLACVSQDVADKVMSMGVDQRKVFVSPMGVDPADFDVSRDESLVKDLGLSGYTVIGWIGSFRKFHGVDTVVKAIAEVVKELKMVKLLLVGDGPARNEMEALVAALGLQSDVLFTGKIAFQQIPRHISLFDVAIVSAGNKLEFHYSPMKLREYMAAGKATIAPKAGEIPVKFSDHGHLLLYEVNDIADLAGKIKDLVTDNALRQRIAEGGYEYVVRTSTWDVEIERMVLHVNKLKSHAA
jgi:glycosyltransferase involved in cell wall biosynthesis